MTTNLGKISVGDPVILDNAKDLGKYGLRRGMEGTCSALINTPDGRKWLYFQPSYSKEVFVIEADRCILDEETKENSIPIEEVASASAS